MGSHVRVSVSFVFVLVITVVTVVPSSIGMGSHVSVEITNTFKLFVTRLFWARQLIINMYKHVLVPVCSQMGSIFHKVRS